MQLRKAAKLFVTVSAIAVLPLIGYAQQADSDEVIEEIVVTGTGVERTEFETPQTVTQYSEEDVRLFTSSSQADLLTQLPGVSAEGGGGEVATNVFHRALPSGGQFSFTPLLYDGIPTFTTFGLNSSAFDVFYRNDLGIERAEFVSGGVSNLFGPGSVAGIVNYISKTGGPDNTGTVQVEAAEEGRFRSDYFFSGPLGGEDSDTFYAVSGYYRFDEGPLKSGLDTQGFQLRGNLKREFSDGSGSITLYGQAIDDSVQFFLPLPLDGVSRERVAGNDGQEVFTMNTVDAIGLSYDTPDGRFATPIADGVLTKGTSIAAVLDKDLTSDWTLNAKLRYAQYDHQFNLFLDGDGLGPNTPETQAEYLTNRGVTDPLVAASAQFTYVETGQALAASDLLFGNRTLDRWRDAKDFSAELSVGRNLTYGDAEHTITIGGFFANSQADDLNYITTYLGDFRNAPKLVDVTFTGYEEDATGAIVASADPTAVFQWTQNGLARANGMTGNRDRSARRTAFYVADQIEKDRWSFDVGVRVERLDGDVKQFNTTTFTMGTDPLLSNNIEQVSYMDGSLLAGTVSTTEWALSAGSLYRLNDTVNLFANFSRGYFFPQIRSVPFSQVPGQEGELASYEGETIDALEIGAKLQTDNFDGYLTFFYTTLDDRRNVDFENDGSGNVVEVVNLQSTEALGIEASGTYHLNEMWSLHGNITLRDSEFTKSENADVLGKELRRQPLEMINFGARFNYNNFDAALMYNFHGDNYANDSNSVKLDSYNLVRLEAGYTFEFDDGQTLRVSGNVFNLTDDQGISEGSPRQGNAQSGAPAQFFVGRPILPRRMMLRVTYDF
ncbi:MAG: TonB-dependent receptor [Gammaproteobacteria bacterium]|nr:TonB-dependent receptor [Gammaproteobacteria bacterium]